MPAALSCLRLGEICQLAYIDKLLKHHELVVDSKEEYKIDEEYKIAVCMNLEVHNTCRRHVRHVKPM